MSIYTLQLSFGLFFCLSLSPPQSAHQNDEQLESPRIITSPTDQFVVSGRVATFICTAIGNPKPQIEWRKNGKRLVTQRYIVLDIPNGSVLRIEPVRPNRDNATYECLADNGIGEPVRALAALNVFAEHDVPKGFPRFTLQPHMQGVERGRSALIPCIADGDPEPHISWLKDMVPIDMSDTRYSYYNSSSLQIIAAEERDQGQYECVAENKIGSAYSELATLYVRTRNVPPYFSIPPEPTYEVMPGSSLNVTCVAVGSPMPYVSWKTGDTDSEIPIGKNVLKLDDIRDSANYTCRARSKLGDIEAITRVIVQSLPRPPTNLRVSAVTPTSVRLLWSYDIGADNIVYFVIRYKMYMDQEFSEISGVTTFYYTVGSLEPYTPYEFNVLAVNSIGRGSPTTSVNVVTGDKDYLNGYRQLATSPRNVEARPLSSSTIVVQWDPPERNNSPLTAYKLFYTARPSLPMTAWTTQTVASNRLTTISHLQPHQIYTIRVQALTSRGAGPLSAPEQVKTQLEVPSQPSDLRATALSSTAVELNWQKPSHSVHPIIGYEIYLNDTFANQEARRSIPDVQRFTLGYLYPDTLYYVRIAGKSRRGEGVPTTDIAVKTEQYVPEKPRDVIATPLNGTAVRAQWKAAINETQNGLIRGYRISVQEVNSNGDFISDPLRYDVANGLAEEYNASGLQPDTEYSIQVAALTRTGVETGSVAKHVRTLGGVPTRPDISIRLLDDEPRTGVQLNWSLPNHTYGQLLDYRLRFGRVDSDQRVEFVVLPVERQKVIRDLDGGARYEFRLAGRNAIGWGQEAIAYIETPEGIPEAPPQNITYRLQSPTTVAVNWEPPLPQYRNGNISGYGVNIHKLSQVMAEYHSSKTRAVFSFLDENSVYSLRVRALTGIGGGPYSASVQLRTPVDVRSAPSDVHALSVSETSVQVWWTDEMPVFNDTLGYQVLYSETAVEDLDVWYKKVVPITSSAEITGLRPKDMYAIRVAAYTNEGLGRLSELITVRTEPTDVVLNLGARDVTKNTMTLAWRQPKRLAPIRYKITYWAHKEFYDSQGLLRQLSIEQTTEYVNSDANECEVNGLMPFTTYQVNVTAIPADQSFRPPARISVTTAMAAPKPMVKPYSIESEDKRQITVILPQASEEYGPISHYLLVVVPKNMVDKQPDKYLMEELWTPVDRFGPYIAAKWWRTAMPNTFSLGDGQKYNGFVNRRLIKGVDYQIFVRAVVDTPQQSLFTSSPFSEVLSLETIFAESDGRNGGNVDDVPGQGQGRGQEEGKGRAANCRLFSSLFRQSPILTVIFGFVDCRLF